MKVAFSVQTPADLMPPPVHVGSRSLAQEVRDEPQVVVRALHDSATCPAKSVHRFR